MKILVTSIGTRGDIEPFLAIADIFRKRNHQVTCLFPEQFRALTESAGFEFVSLGSKFLELMNSNAGKIAMGGGKFGFKKIKAYYQLIQKQPEANKEMMLQQEACIQTLNPDKIIHHSKTIYPLLWSLKNKHKTSLICLVPHLHYVKGYSHVVFHSNFGDLLNKLTYKLVTIGFVKNVLYAQKFLNDNNIKTNATEIKRALQNYHTIYTLSPTLFSKPSYWSNNLNVLGFHERDKTVQWTPTSSLVDFIKQHPKIIFISFGSMVHPNPEKTTRTLLHILEKHNIPAIINTSGGGLVKPISYNNKLFYVTNTIPYDWIFTKVYGVIHHGGAGTTHMALKNKCVNLIIPHIVDQYIWNTINYNQKTGPLGNDIGSITSSNLEPKILDLYNNRVYKENAIEIGTKMSKENYTEAFYQSIIR